MVVCGVACAMGLAGVSVAKPAAKRSVHQFQVKDIDGKPVKLSTFRGKVMLFVNTASQCGYTSQYAGLQRLYKKYGKKGLVVLGFPANDFGQQEPGTNKQIKAFCSSKYHVTFPMFSKIVVTGKKKHPLYRFLTSKKLNGAWGGSVSWNFNKFLVNQKGQLVAHFGSGNEPEGKAIVSAIKKLLK
jgi:glutathione peroxidase